MDTQYFSLDREVVEDIGFDPFEDLISVLAGKHDSFFNLQLSATADVVVLRMEWVPEVPPKSEITDLMDYLREIEGFEEVQGVEALALLASAEEV